MATSLSQTAERAAMMAVAFGLGLTVGIMREVIYDVADRHGKYPVCTVPVPTQAERGQPYSQLAPEVSPRPMPRPLAPATSPRPKKAVRHA